MTGRVKLQTGRIDNLTPPGDQAPPTIIMKKNCMLDHLVVSDCRYDRSSLKYPNIRYVTRPMLAGISTVILYAI